MQQLKNNSESQKDEQPRKKFVLSGLFAKQVKVEEKFEIEVKRNPTIVSIEKAFSVLLDCSSFFSRLKEEIEKINCTAEDIEEFTLLLSKYEHKRTFPNRAGIFISELCNRASDEKIVLRLSHLEVPINYIGYRNQKDIYVVGDVGNYAGQYMQKGNLTIEGHSGSMLGAYLEKGEIRVTGNALDYVGMEMVGGNIIIEGLARDRLGYKMKGGYILVLKSARDEVGCQMKSGSITIMGNARNHVGKSMESGRILIHGYAGYDTNKDAGGSVCILKKEAHLPSW